jgi:formylglycine-generating enzyme required for sulfatase activity
MPEPNDARNETKRTASPDSTDREKLPPNKYATPFSTAMFVATKSGSAKLPVASTTFPGDGFRHPSEISPPLESMSKTDKSPLQNSEIITNSIGIKLRLISPYLMPDSHGTFIMGSGANSSEGPQHPVTIRDTFRIAVHKTTQAQFNEIMKRNPSWFSPSGAGKDRVKGDTSKHPVDSVAYFDAAQFCNKLSVREGLRPCYRINADAMARTGDGGTKWPTVERLSDGTGYRLPSEAEWEYCARAGTTAQYGFDEQRLEDNVWYVNNSDQVTHPVDTKQPNRWGFYHMNGLLWEWCDDVWHANYADAPSDGSAWTTFGEHGTHIARGGAWCCDVESCRSANRTRFMADHQGKYLGFRVVRVSP